MSQFYGPGPLTRHQVIELDILTYDGERFTVSATSDAEYERIVASGGRRGAIYAGLRALRDTHAAEIRERFVNILRRVSGVQPRRVAPGDDFNVAHALVGTERNVRQSCSSVPPSRSFPTSLRVRAPRARLPGRVPSRRSCAGDHGAQAGRPRGIRRPAGGDDAQAPVAPRPGRDAAAGPWLAAGGIRRRDWCRCRRAGAPVDGRTRAARRCTVDAALQPR